MRKCARIHIKMDYTLERWKSQINQKQKLIFFLFRVLHEWPARVQFISFHFIHIYTHNVYNSEMYIYVPCRAASLVWHILCEIRMDGRSVYGQTMPGNCWRRRIWMLVNVCIFAESFELGSYGNAGRECTNKHAIHWDSKQIQQKRKRPKETETECELQSSNMFWNVIRIFVILFFYSGIHYVSHSERLLRACVLSWSLEMPVFTHIYVYIYLALSNNTTKKLIFCLPNPCSFRFYIVTHIDKHTR